jgi:MFS family permease
VQFLEFSPMHFEDPSPSSAKVATTEAPSGRWYKNLTRYHWFVFVVASLGWLFDTMDQQLFNLARMPAVTELLRVPPGDPAVKVYGGYTTSIFILGWAIGGLIFGILGDRIGRAKTMMLTILLYSAFTGLSALATDIWWFSFFRFLTGLGVGGEFAVGVSLVAEVVPDQARPGALGALQALSAVGNMLAAVIGIGLALLEMSGTIGSSWRPMFLVGVVPALLAIPIFLKMEEPAKWKAAAALRAQQKRDGTAPRLGSIGELFTHPRWRRNTIVGMLLAFSGVVGLWGIGVFSADLTRSIFRPHFEGQAKAMGLSAEAAQSFVAGRLTLWSAITLLLFNFGAFFGISAFSWVTQHTGRKPAFAVSFVLAMLATAFTFWQLGTFSEIFWMIPLMGFCQLTLFGGYAIYFPELFPTRLRSTGTSFCYNVGRLVAATGPTGTGLLTKHAFGRYPEPLNLRYAGVAMCAVFLIGLLALPFAPETKGQPLPE